MRSRQPRVTRLGRERAAGTGRRDALAEVEEAVHRFDGFSKDVAFVEMDGGMRILAIDEPSSRGLDEPFAAVMFPAVHSRLVLWWRFHAWRSVDLRTDTLLGVEGWRLYSAAVSSRSFIEHTGCLLHESKKFAAAWAAAKAVDGDAKARTQSVYRGSAIRMTPARKLEAMISGRIGLWPGGRRPALQYLGLRSAPRSLRQHLTKPVGWASTSSR